MPRLSRSTRALSKLGLPIGFAMMAAGFLAFWVFGTLFPLAPFTTVAWVWFTGFLLIAGGVVVVCRL